MISVILRCTRPKTEGEFEVKDDPVGEGEVTSGPFGPTGCLCGSYKGRLRKT